MNRALRAFALLALLSFFTGAYGPCFAMDPGGQGGGAAATPSLLIVQCTEDGHAVGTVAAQPGQYLHSCIAQAKWTGASAWGEGYVSVPGAPGPDPAYAYDYSLIADHCWDEAAAFKAAQDYGIDVHSSSVAWFATCASFGYFGSPPPGPQSDDDDEP